MASLTVTAAVDGFNAAAQALPSSLTANMDLVALSTQLKSLAQVLQPISTEANNVQVENVLANLTYLSNNLVALSHVVDLVPTRERTLASRETLLALIKLGTTRFDVWTVWAPELWVLLGTFFLVLLLKSTSAYLLSGKARRRAVGSLAATEIGATLSTVTTAATSQLARKAVSIQAHTLNLVMSTIALAFQLAAYRVFAVPR